MDDGWPDHSLPLSLLKTKKGHADGSLVTVFPIMNQGRH